MSRLCMNISFQFSGKYLGVGLLSHMPTRTLTCETLPFSQSGCTFLHTHWQCMWFTIALYFCWYTVSYLKT